jgi:hypothetical protein
MTDTEIRELLATYDARGQTADYHTRMAFERACADLAREVLRLREGLRAMGKYAVGQESRASAYHGWGGCSGCLGRFVANLLAGREWNGGE